MSKKLIAKDIYRFIRSAVIIAVSFLAGVVIGKNYLSTTEEVYHFKEKLRPELVAPRKENIMPFKKGEHLVYRLKSKGINVGTSDMVFMGEVEKEGQALYYIKFTTEMPGVIDTEHIYTRKKDFLPVLIERDIEKLGKKQPLIEKYDQQAGVLRVYRPGEDEPLQQYDIGANINNAIALTFYYRSTPDLLKENRKNRIVLPKFTFDLVFKGEKRVTTYLGTENAFYFSSEPSKFHFWLSKSKERLPLKIQQPGLMGYSMILDSVKMD